MIKRKFIVFINPISGTNSKIALQQTVEDCLQKQHFSFEILATQANGDYTFLPKKITDENITDIIICGGDGTIGYIVKHIINIKINIGIIPMGSGNGLAFTAGIPKNPLQAMQVIVSNHPKYVDAFMVNDYFACHNFGVGFDATIAHEFAAGKKRGPFNYIKLTAKNFFKATPHLFSISINNTILNVKAFFVAVLNSNQFGNSLTIAPKASLHDGLLDVVVVKKDNKLSLFIKLLVQLKRGKVVNVANDKKTFHYFQTEKIIIHNPTKALMHVDGEPVATAIKIDIQIIKNAFVLLHPKPF